MQVYTHEQTIELTRRNLNVLLAKLDGHPKDSACTIFKQGWCVKAIEDEEHYSDRLAGTMIDETEKAIDDLA